MSVIGLVLNAVTLIIAVAVVVVFRIIDRDNRSLEKLKRYAASLQEEIDGLVDKSVRELKNTASDLEVNARAGRELLSDVSQEDAKLSDIRDRITNLENSIGHSETAMEQLASLTESVEENMRNLRQESDFVTAVAAKVKEIDDRSRKLQTELGRVLSGFEEKASESLEKISEEIRSDFETGKKDYMRILEDLKESAENDWSLYVDREKESISRTLDELRSFSDSLTEEEARISQKALSEMNSGAEETITSFRKECDEIIRSEQDKVNSVKSVLDHVLEDLTAQIENVKFAHRESMEQIRKEKEQMDDVLLQMRQKGAELIDQTVAQMKEGSRRTIDVMKGESETLQKANSGHAEELENSFREMLSSVSSQLNTMKQAHESALSRLNDERSQMLSLVARQREKLEGQIENEIASVLAGIKEKTDTYTAIFDAKASEAKSRFEKELSLLQEKQRREQSEIVSQIETAASDIDAKLEAFQSQAEEMELRYQGKEDSVQSMLDRVREDLASQTETVQFAHRESMEQIRKEKEQMEESFLQMKQRGAEMIDQTVTQMKEGARRTVESVKGELEVLQQENNSQADQLKVSFQDALSSVAAQLNTIKETHEASLGQLKNERSQMLAIVAQQREKLEERVKKEIASVLAGVKEKTDTYTAIFDAKVSDAKSRIEKDLSVLQEKQKRDQTAFFAQIETAGSTIDKRLEKFKSQAEDVETRYQKNIQIAVERSLKLEDEIFENLRRDIEARAEKSEKEIEAHLAALFGKIEATNSEILRHFGEMRGEVEMKKEESKKELEQLKSAITNALHEADTSNREKLTQMLTETENSRQRLKEDLNNFIGQVGSDMKIFETRITDELNRSESRLAENTQKLDKISSEIDTSGAQMIETASSGFKQKLESVADDFESKIAALNHLFEEHKAHFDYKMSQIDSAETDLTRYMAEVASSLEKSRQRTDSVLDQFAAEVDERRNREWVKTEEGYRKIYSTLESLGKEIESVKAAAYESTAKQMSIYEDQFFADLRERTDALNLKVLEWQQQVEKDMEQMLAESKRAQSEMEEQRRASIVEGMKKIEEQTDQEFGHLSNRIQALQEKIASDALHNEKEIEDFKILIKKNMEGVQREAQNAFEVEFSKYDISVTAKLGDHQKNLEETVESAKNKMEENISDLMKRFETSYSDLKVMHSNVIQQMKNTEADLKSKYADLKTSVSENVNIIKDTFAAQKDGVIEKSKRETDDLAKAILAVGQDVEKLSDDLQQKSDNALVELNKKYEEFYAEFNYKTDTLLNELDYKTRDFRQSSADTREKIEAVQQKLHNDVEEGRKNLSFRLDEITKRIRDFESQTKLFERADSMKKKLTEDIATLRNEIDQLVIKRKEFKDIDMTLAKVKAIEADITGKLAQLQANKRTVDDLEKDFKRLRDTSAEINSRIDKVTSSNDVVMEMQARLRQLDDLEKVVEDQFSRLEKKEHVLNHATMGIDKNFEEMQELENRIKSFEVSFNEFIGKLASASKRIDVLDGNKERADFAVEKLVGLDSMLGEIDAKIESTKKARQWLADIESRLVQLNDSAVRNLATLKEVVDTTASADGKGKIDQSDLILRLARQGWSAGDIAKKLNIGLGEVQLIIEMNLDR